MALKDHARLAVLLDSTYLREVTSLDLQTDAGNQRVEALEGLAGWTPGSGIVTITISLGVPIDGQEYDAQEACVDGRYVAAQIPVGTKSYVGTGKIMTVGISQSVNANTEETIAWEGELNPLE